MIVIKVGIGAIACQREFRRQLPVSYRGVVATQREFILSILAHAVVGGVAGIVAATLKYPMSKQDRSGAEVDLSPQTQTKTIVADPGKITIPRTFIQSVNAEPGNGATPVSVSKRGTQYPALRITHRLALIAQVGILHKGARLIVDIVIVLPLAGKARSSTVAITFQCELIELGVE